MSRISFNTEQARDLYYALQWGMSEVGNRVEQGRCYEETYDSEYSYMNDDTEELKRLKKMSKRLKTFLQKHTSFVGWDEDDGQ